MIVGAKGHAKEILDLLQEDRVRDELYFFDNVTQTTDTNFLGYPLVRSLNDLEKLFFHDPRFMLGLGGTKRRRDLVDTFGELGGKLISVISQSAKVSNNSRIGNGVNIMSFSSISGDAVVGEGVLVHSHCSIHHDCHIGAYSEISPGARILGYSRIGRTCSIGSNAVILPGITITDNVIVGAGAVVTKDIEREGVYVGTPSRKIK